MAEDDVDPFNVLAEPAKDEAKIIADHNTDLRTFYRAKQEAYRRVFSGKGTQADIENVREDLRIFCRGETTPWADDERMHCVLTGRHEVYTRIFDHLDLDFDTYFKRYGQPIGDGNNVVE